MRYSLDRIIDIVQDGWKGREANIDSITEIFKILVLMERTMRLSGYDWIDPQHIKVDSDGEILVTWKSRMIVFDIMTEYGEAYMCAVERPDPNSQYPFIPGNVVFPAKEWNVRDCLAILQSMVWK